MANHQRRGPKSTRAGCLLCKPHKRQGAPRKERMRPSDRRRILDGELEMGHQPRRTSDRRDDG